MKSNKLLTLLFIALGIWMAISTYWYVCVFKGLCYEGATTTEQTTGTQAAKFYVNDGSQWSVSSPDGLRFPVAGSDPIVGESVKPKLDELAAYLKQNKSKRLFVNGKYKTSEANGENLGKLRAQNLAAELTKRGVNANQLVLGTMASNADLTKVGNFLESEGNYNFKQENGFVAFNGKAAPSSAANDYASISIQDGNGFSIDVKDDFDFKRNTDNVTFGAGANNALDKVNDYLQKNKKRQLQVKGAYASDEVNNTQFPNLGLARAEKVKNELLKRGGDANQIRTGYTRVNKLPFRNDVLKNGMEFSFQSKQELDQAESKLMAEIQKNLSDIGSKFLYFESGVSTIKLSPELSNYIDDVKLYLAQNPNKKVKFIGHTDNVGSDAANEGYANKRAKFVKKYFVQRGIRETQIITIGRGEAQPIASNDTEEGRAQNRRVEITIN